MSLLILRSILKELIPIFVDVAKSFIYLFMFYLDPTFISVDPFTTKAGSIIYYVLTSDEENDKLTVTSTVDESFVPLEINLGKKRVLTILCCWFYLIFLSSIPKSLFCPFCPLLCLPMIYCWFVWAPF